MFVRGLQEEYSPHLYEKIKKMKSAVGIVLLAGPLRIVTGQSLREGPKTKGFSFLLLKSKDRCYAINSRQLKEIGVAPVVQVDHEVADLVEKNMNSRRVSKADSNRLEWVLNSPTPAFCIELRNHQSRTSEELGLLVWQKLRELCLFL
eukprot:Protomagalhaensia_wolfi_Nauph_80__5476@NODE_59_length_4115_cov_62_940628_g49_i0_p4_GENE_NODE_59_length_4115_cov_62_940628_g49_i0NODE_59_length_4115_cov_62_940628_g49_i0_p4_ORF_typecomplete_len148_score12_20_NODE_59_length_4115_cov_62_940628_g49_i036344077